MDGNAPSQNLTAITFWSEFVKIIYTFQVTLQQFPYCPSTLQNPNYAFLLLLAVAHTRAVPPVFFTIKVKNNSL